MWNVNTIFDTHNTEAWQHLFLSAQMFFSFFLIYYANFHSPFKSHRAAQKEIRDRFGGAMGKS